MKNRIITIALMLGVTLMLMLSAVGTQTAYAGCLPGQVCPPPSGGGGGGGGGDRERRATRTPTPVPTNTPAGVATATATCVPNSANGDVARCATPLPCFSISGSGNGICTPTPAGGGQSNIPVTGGGGSTNGGSSGGQNPGGSGSPFNFPGPLGMIIAVLIIVICLGLIIVVRRGRLAGAMADGSAQPADPAISGNLNGGTSQFYKPQFTDPNLSGGTNQFQKADNQFQKADSHFAKIEYTGPTSQNASNQFIKGDDQFIKGDSNNPQLGGDGGDQLGKIM